MKIAAHSPQQTRDVIVELMKRRQREYEVQAGRSIGSDRLSAAAGSKALSRLIRDLEEAEIEYQP